MKALIVGGTGVISTAVVNEAVKQGIDVTCINRGYNHGVAPNPNVKTLHFDVRDRKIADKLLAGKVYDVVVDFICFNAQHIRYSLDLFHDKCKQYVFISTDSVYKLQKDGHYDELTPRPNPEWAYSYQKAECEEIVRSFCSSHNLIYTIVRPSVTYGNTRIPYGFMPGYGYHYTLIERIKAGKPVVCWNDGKNVQTIMRIEDFALGMVGLWGNEKAYNEDFGICGESVTWSEVLDAIEETIGVKAIRINVPVETIIKKLPYRRGEFLVDRAEDHYVSNQKLKNNVPSFSLKYPLKKGIEQTIRYYEENNRVLGIDYTYDGQCDMLIRTVSPSKLSFIPYDEKASRLEYFFGRQEDVLPVKVIAKIYNIIINRVLKRK